jgi:hypothetical protein
MEPGLHLVYVKGWIVRFEAPTGYRFLPNTPNSKWVGHYLTEFPQKSGLNITPIYGFTSMYITEYATPEEAFDAEMCFGNHGSPCKRKNRRSTHPRYEVSLGEKSATHQSRFDMENEGRRSSCCCWGARFCANC